MANVTRIKAKDDGPKTRAEESEPVSRKVSIKTRDNGKADKKKADIKKEAIKKEKKAAKKDKKVGYFRGAFREMRQVRWPSRKETWKLTFSVILYVVILATAIMLLDALLQFVFSKILGGN